MSEPGGLLLSLPMFRWIALLLLLGLFVCSARAAERVFDFAEDKLQTVPEGFRSVLSGTGEPGDWQVILDDMPSMFAPVSTRSTSVAKRRVLAQLSQDRTATRYPMLVYQDELFEDFTLTTHFKLVGGAMEQMAGIAFRIQDEKNYYYIRASALGTNLSFFKVIRGELRDRVSSNVAIPTNQWHELVVECRGNQFRARLNGKELLLVSDITGAEAFDRGRIGFWTKSDSVTYFADTRLSFTTKEPFAQVLVRDAVRRYPRLLGLRIYTLNAAGDTPTVLASADPAELGQPGGKPEAEAIRRGTVFFGKIEGNAHVTLPLHDKNGEPIAAVRVIMNSFPGQTEQNAMIRALPIVKKMEGRVPTARDLTAQ